MSDLQPRGEPLVLDGREWRLVWTLAVIERVQEHYDSSIGEVILRLADERALPSTVAYLLSELLAEDARLRGGGPAPTEEDLMRLVDVETLGTAVNAILRSYGISMPEEDDEEIKNPSSRSH